MRPGAFPTLVTISFIFNDDFLLKGKSGEFEIFLSDTYERIQSPESDFCAFSYGRKVLFEMVFEGINDDDDVDDDGEDDDEDDDDDDDDVQRLFFFERSVEKARRLPPIG